MPPGPREHPCPAVVVIVAVIQRSVVARTGTTWHRSVIGVTVMIFRALWALSFFCPEQKKSALLPTWAVGSFAHGCSGPHGLWPAAPHSFHKVACALYLWPHMSLSTQSSQAVLPICPHVNANYCAGCGCASTPSTVWFSTRPRKVKPASAFTQGRKRNPAAAQPQSASTAQRSGPSERGTPKLEDEWPPRQ